MEVLNALLVDATRDPNGLRRWSDAVNARIVAETRHDGQDGQDGGRINRHPF